MKEAKNKETEIDPEEDEPWRILIRSHSFMHMSKSLHLQRNVYSTARRIRPRRAYNVIQKVARLDVDVKN